MVIDPSALEAYREVMGEDADSFIADVMQTYLNSSIQLLAQLDETFVSGDVPTFHRAAHTLKSSSATVGAMTVAGLAATLESDSEVGFPPEVEKKLNALRHDHQEAELELIRWLGKLGYERSTSSPAT